MTTPRCFPKPPMRLQCLRARCLAQPYTVPVQKTETAGSTGSSATPLRARARASFPWTRGSAWCTSTGACLALSRRRARWPWWPRTSAFLLGPPCWCWQSLSRDRSEARLWCLSIWSIKWKWVSRSRQWPQSCAFGPTHWARRELPRSSCTGWSPARIPLRLASILSQVGFSCGDSLTMNPRNCIILDFLPGSQRTNCHKMWALQ